MKKIVLYLVALLTAQVTHAQILELGVKAGLSGCTLMLDDTKSVSMTTESNNTYNFGVYGRVKVPVIGFYVQPELMMNTRASNFTVDNAGTKSVFLNKVNYFEVPIMFGFKVLKIARFYGGPNFQFVTKQTTEIPTNNPLFEKSDLKSSTTGMQLGIGADLARIRADLKWDANIGSMGAPFVYNGISPNMRSSMISIQVGFKLFDLL
jgi:hypothetical protein